MNGFEPLIVGIGGTTRNGSLTEAALQLALDAAARMGARTRLFGGADLLLPPYQAGVDAGAAAAALVRALREADGVLVATPSYHGSISGLVKNALDYTEDLRRDERVYLEGRAVGCIVCADGPQAIGSTLAALRSIVHALRGWPTPIAVGIHSPARPLDPQRGHDPQVVSQLETVAGQVVRFARFQHAGALAA